jgi:hypothetical protein
MRGVAMLRRASTCFLAFLKGRCCREAIVAVICGVRARWHRFVKPLGSYFRCYLWCSRLLASRWEAIGEPHLLPFVAFALIGIALRRYGGRLSLLFVMFVLGARWHRLAEPLGSHFCCHRHRLAKPWGNHFSCYLVFALIRVSLGSRWEAFLLVLFAVFALMRFAFGSRFCCYLRCSRSLASPCGAIGEPLLLLCAVRAHSRHLGKPLLLLFAAFALFSIALRCYWEAIFAELRPSNLAKQFLRCAQRCEAEPQVPRTRYWQLETQTQMI